MTFSGKSATSEEALNVDSFTAGVRRYLKTVKVRLAKRQDVLDETQDTPVSSKIADQTNAIGGAKSKYP